MIHTARISCVAVVTMLCAACGTVGSETADSQQGAPAEAAPASNDSSQSDDTEHQVAPQYSPVGDIEFKAALDLGQADVGSEPQLRGGRVAVSREWPASLYATFRTSSNRLASCTAALIGPQAMLTAAHCVPSSGSVTFSYEGHGQPYKTDCTQHPNYGSDASADFALCKVERSFAAPPGFLYETVNTAPMDSLLGTTVILTGFGCISDLVAEDHSDNKYRIGFNSVDETSRSTTRKRGYSYYDPHEKNNLLTKDDPQLANLCPGDSGGPALSRTGGASGAFASRVIVGVNSRVFYADFTKTSYSSSLISATGGPDFRTWAENWALSVAHVEACGLTGSLPNCRS